MLFPNWSAARLWPINTVPMGQKRANQGTSLQSCTFRRGYAHHGLCRWALNQRLYCLHERTSPRLKTPIRQSLKSSSPLLPSSAAHLGFPPPSPSQSALHSGASARVPRRRMCVRLFDNLDRRYRNRLCRHVVEDDRGVPRRPWRRRRPEEGAG